MNKKRTLEILGDVWGSLLEWTGVCIILVGLPRAVITAFMMRDIQLGIQDGALTLLLASAFSAPVYAAMDYRQPGKGGIYLLYLVVGWVAGIFATVLVGRGQGVIVYSTMTAFWSILAALVVCGVAVFLHVVSSKNIQKAWHG